MTTPCLIRPARRLSSSRSTMACRAIYPGAFRSRGSIGLMRTGTTSTGLLVFPVCLKRGLADDMVVAPYASALALMIAPNDACDNLHRLSEEGAEGAYGFYEAID